MTANDGTSSFVMPAYVRFTVVDQQAVLLNMRTGFYFGLDEIATQIMRLIVGQTPVDGVVTQLNGEYDVDIAQLRQDVWRLIIELRNNGLLEEKNIEPQAAPGT